MDILGGLPLLDSLHLRWIHANPILLNEVGNKMDSLLLLREQALRQLHIELVLSQSGEHFFH